MQAEHTQIIISLHTQTDRGGGELGLGDCVEKLAKRYVHFHAHPKRIAMDGETPEKNAIPGRSWLFSKLPAQIRLQQLVSVP